jgi:magnesium chelatase subunit H
MTLNLTSLGRAQAARQTTPIKVVIVTMDTHLASSIHRASQTLRREFPGLSLSLHAASEYAGNEALIARCKADIASADIVVAGMLFLEDHFLPILDDLRARRMHCDAMICMASATEVVQLTRLGQFDMGKPAARWRS